MWQTLKKSIAHNIKFLLASGGFDDTSIENSFDINVYCKHVCKQSETVQSSVNIKQTTEILTNNLK